MILGQCVTITPCRLPDAIAIPMTTCLCGSLPQRSVKTTTLVPLELSFNAYSYIHTGNSFTQGRFNKHTAHSLYRIMVMTTSVIVCVMEKGTIVPGAGLKPTSLAFWVNVLPLHHVGSPMSPLYLYLPVYAITKVKSTTILHNVL